MNNINIWDKSFKKNPENQGLNNFLKKQINGLLKLLYKKDKVLDLGCGIGDKTNYIKKRNFGIIGIDSSRSAVKYGRRKFKIKLYVQDARKTKFKKGSFNAIITIALLHCFKRKDREKIANEIKRLLRDNGLLFGLVLSNRDMTKKAGKKIEERTYLQDSGKYFHLFTKGELKKLFRDFKVLKLKKYERKIKGKINSVFVFILRKS